jgi:hypothetical protein
MCPPDFIIRGEGMGLFSRFFVLLCFSFMNLYSLSGLASDSFKCPPPDAPYQPPSCQKGSPNSNQLRNKGNLSEDQIKQKIREERSRLPQIKAIEKWTLKEKNTAYRTFAPSLVRLSDGRYRMYSNGPNFKGIDSSISDDGLHFTKEAGLRLSGTGKSGDANCSLSHPWVIPVARGYRLYYQANAVCDWHGDIMAKSEPQFKIMSAFSQDGLTFVHDDGIRVNTDTKLLQAAHGRIIKLSDGTLRMYFSANFRPHGPSDIQGASSQDGLTWQLDAQPTVLTSHDPTVLNQDGKIIMYTASDRFNMLKLVSDDGVKFTPTAWVEFQDEAGPFIGPVADIDIISGPQGELRIYGTWKDSPGIGVFEKVK